MALFGQGIKFSVAATVPAGERGGDAGMPQGKESLHQQHLCTIGRWSFPDLTACCFLVAAFDLVQKLLVVDPTRRLKIEEALEHPWLQVGAKLACPSAEGFSSRGDWRARRSGVVLREEE